ncbi:MAG: hypothetical protein GXZ08_10410 [Tissierellia bacterium]|nr:hypothetical protein [Tissierellia bacterium]
MVLTKRNSSELSKSLQNKFLYDNDINSIHILLNLYDIEDNIGKIYPRYSAMSLLKKNINKFLSGREGMELASKNLSELIHEDINRLELYIYLEGYRTGYKALKFANILEKLTLRHFDVATLYRMNYLYRYNCNYDDVRRFKNQIYSYILKDVKNIELFKSTTYKYCSAIIKPKVLCLNGYLDNQVKMEYDEDGPVFSYEGEPFTKKELNILYKRIVKMIYRDAARLYKDAFWDGLNDRVLNRYK